MLTDFLGLTMTDASEVSMSYLEWLTLMNGVSVNSNMELIDGAMKDMDTVVEVGAVYYGYEIPSEFCSNVLKSMGGGSDE